MLRINYRILIAVCRSTTICVLCSFSFDYRSKISIIRNSIRKYLYKPILKSSHALVMRTRIHLFLARTPLRIYIYNTSNTLAHNSFITKQTNLFLKLFYNINTTQKMVRILKLHIITKNCEISLSLAQSKIHKKKAVGQICLHSHK